MFYSRGALRGQADPLEPVAGLPLDPSGSSCYVPQMAKLSARNGLIEKTDHSLPCDRMDFYYWLNFLNFRLSGAGGGGVLRKPISG